MLDVLRIDLPIDEELERCAVPDVGLPRAPVGFGLTDPAAGPPPAKGELTAAVRAWVVSRAPPEGVPRVDPSRQTPPGWAEFPKLPFPAPQLETPLDPPPRTAVLVLAPEPERDALAPKRAELAVCWARTPGRQMEQKRILRRIETEIALLSQFIESSLPGPASSSR